MMNMIEEKIKVHRQPGKILGGETWDWSSGLLSSIPMVSRHKAILLLDISIP